MPRGGKRIGSGSKSRWKTGKTKTIRVPELIADQVIQLAVDIDRGKTVVTLKENEVVVNTETVTESENKDTIDLSNVPLTHVKGEIAVRLTDLVRKGYRLLPKNLSDLAHARLSRLNI